MSLHGYLDRWSVVGGDDLRVYVSDETADAYEATLVRLGYPDHHPEGPGFEEKIVTCTGAGVYPGRVQVAQAGSFAYAPQVKGLARAEVVSVGVSFWPTFLHSRRQVLLAFGGGDDGPAATLCILENATIGLAVQNGGGLQLVVRTASPVLERVWYRLHACWDRSTGRVAVTVDPVHGPNGPRRSPAFGKITRESLEGRMTITGPEQASGELVAIGAGWSALRHGRPVPSQSFDGKIEAPWVAANWSSSPQEAQSALLAMWDFSEELRAGRADSPVITDVSSSRAHGVTVNRPTRAVTGSTWDGSKHSWLEDPSHYGALYCHTDDLDDADWDVDFTLSLPRDLESGMYAVRLSSGGRSDRMPLYVRRRPDCKAKRLLLLIPTATYLAYANARRVTDAELAELYFGRTRVLNPSEMVLAQHREYGLSLYDTHADGSGVCHSTRRRPILNQRPGESAWDSFGLACHIADLRLNAWARAREIDWDVATDEDLHRDGLNLLSPYRAVVTGSHPEYCSTRMLDSLHDYVTAGGRLAYLGGNGFCQRVAFDPANLSTVEVRRWGGGGDWQAAPGEYYFSLSSELGGMWRNLGRPPHELAGSGYIAEGFDRCSYYRRRPESYDPRAAWIFEGTDDAEHIGEFGLVGDGAAGLEIDSYDPNLGSPEEALVLASSEGHSSTYMLTDGTLPNPASSGAESPRVRADIVYYVTPTDGAVFSVGSIAWCGSLWSNGGDNNVSRITENVLRRFASEHRLSW